MKHSDFIKKVRDEDFVIEHFDNKVKITKHDFVFVTDMDKEVDFDDFVYKYNQSCAIRKEIKHDFDNNETSNNHKLIDDIDNNSNYKFINNELERDRSTNNDFGIGKQDLYPSMLLRDESNNGSFLDPSHPLFGTRKEKTIDSDIDVPSLARFDQISPDINKKKKKKGNDPNPDHFKPDNDFM